jgi:hypothetical protein
MPTLKHNLGGHLAAAFFGTLAIAWVASQFVFGLLAYINISGFAGYGVTNPFALVIGIFTFALPSIVFLLLWAAFYLGYIGIAFRGKR